MSNENQNQVVGSESNEDITVVTGDDGIERVFDADGDDILNEEDCCSEADIEEAIKGFILGDITLAQLEGISAEEMYQVADMGYDLFEEGKLEDARKIFEGLYTYNPMDAYFHSVLGSIYQKQEKFEDAIRHYTSAVELYNEDITAWTNLGETQMQHAAALQSAGKSEEAAEAFSNAVECLGYAVEQAGDDDENDSALRARALINVAASIYEARQAS